MYLKNITTYLTMFGLLVMMACMGNEKPEETQSPGFNAANSDPKAIEIADKVMEAMGGQKNWDETRYIVWNFFGSRKLYWDKWTGNVRIESSRDNFAVLVNVNDLTGQVGKDGKILTDPDSLSKYLAIGKSMWINDSYWLVMPFKLKDPGVTLKYLRQDTTSFGKQAEVIQLTFDSVGDTPNNKYEVYVDSETNLVGEWAFFQNADDEVPRFRNRWRHYKNYGNILLSFDRGEGYYLSEIEVLEEMPESVFKEL
jgi:hypothetical protein